MTICNTFGRLADRTWRRIGSAHQLGLNWSEETATESLLLALKRAHPSEVFIRAFTKREEVTTGADWEWWVVGSSGRAFGMRVQAKRIKLPAERFRNLGYRAPNASSNQMDTLIQAALSAGVTPVYCFYVHSLKWPRGIWPSQNQPEPTKRVDGCMIGHGERVRQAASDELARLRRILQPWHVLVCPDDEQSADLAVTARDALAQIAVVRERIQRVPGEEGDPDKVPYVSEVRRVVPDYVETALSTGEYPESEFRPRGVVLIRQPH